MTAPATQAPTTQTPTAQTHTAQNVDSDSTDARRDTDVVPSGEPSPLPDASAVVDRVFDLAASLLSSQREFTERSWTVAGDMATATANALAQAYRLWQPADGSAGDPGPTHSGPAAAE